MDSNLKSNNDLIRYITICYRQIYLKSFPIKNLETFNEVESLLGDSEDAKQYLVYVNY